MEKSTYWESLQTTWIITPLEGWRIIIGMEHIMKSLQPIIGEVPKRLCFAE